ncbi:Hypothetical predicted protein, partial [Pelobates cultripes]
MRPSQGETATLLDGKTAHTPLSAPAFLLPPSPPALDIHNYQQRQQYKPDPDKQGCNLLQGAPKMAAGSGICGKAMRPTQPRWRDPLQSLE